LLVFYELLQLASVPRDCRKFIDLSDFIGVFVQPYDQPRNIILQSLGKFKRAL